MTQCGPEEYRRMIAWVLDHVPQGSPRCLFVGVQGVQGSGKSTACAAMVQWLETQGRHRAATLSLDDFYLPHHALQGKIRGPPGTHDLELMRTTLLRIMSAQTQDILVPVYDKSAHGGQGDRASQGRPLKLPLDVLFLEGWCMGFTGDAFARYEREVYPLLDALIWLDAPIECAYEWRERAEAARREAGDEAMTSEEVRRFVDEYMPFYRHHGRWRAPHTLTLTLGGRMHQSETKKE